MLLFMLVCLCALWVVRASPSRRIIGGELADIRFFPHAVFLYHAAKGKDKKDYAIGCGSSIISQRLVITAAHCLNHNTIEILLYVGKSTKFDGEIYEVKKKIIHKGFTSTWHTNDIGLLLTKTPIRYGENVKAAIVSATYKSFNSATICGWGKIDKDVNELALDLRYLPIPFVPSSKCHKKLKLDMVGKICAGYGTFEKATAHGDSGSGLMVGGNTIVGLLNGDFWYQPNIDVYANITYHYGWIQDTAKTSGVHFSG